jgi:hypothetical protein
MQIQTMYNPIVIHLLRSPLHGLMSESTMLVTYTGHRSGRTYATVDDLSGRRRQTQKSGPPSRGGPVLARAFVVPDAA